MKVVLAVVIGYLLGSIPFAYIAGRLKRGVDIRQMGGGNMGALNVMHHVGTVVGYAVWFADMAKGLLAVFIAQWLDLSLAWVIVVGFAAVAGHNWPVFVKFRGGKGVGTTMGVFLALVPLEFVISLGVLAIVVCVTSNPVLSISIALATLPLFIWHFTGQAELIFFSLGMAVFLGTRYLIAGIRRGKGGADIKKGLIFNKEYHFWQAKKG